MSVQPFLVDTGIKINKQCKANQGSIW